MKKAILLTLALALSGCTTLYSEQATYKPSDDAKPYQFTAKMGLGFTGRKITILCNGRPLMKLSAHYWTHRMVMTATLDGQPVAATCGGDDGVKVCTVNLAGNDIATLTF